MLLIIGYDEMNFLSLNSHPDVMIEAYKSDGSSALFFIIFLVITLYLLTNVVCN